MARRLELEILAQPDDRTCGPTCLHALYRYYGDPIPLRQVIDETPQLDQGGTLAVLLGCHALRRGYEARIYTYNLLLFDPTWFASAERESTADIHTPAERELLIERLQAQAQIKFEPRIVASCRAYGEFLRLGGEICMRDLNAGLIRQYLEKEIPLLTGLSATYLYRGAREIGPTSEPDDVRGLPVGHFVVLCGYDLGRETVDVADPYQANPLSEDRFYDMQLDRLICAIMLGVLTHDANLLIVQPGDGLLEAQLADSGAAAC